MRTIITAIGILILVILLVIVIHSLAGQVSLPTAIQDVLGGIVNSVSDLGKAIGRALSGIVPRPGGN